MKRIEIKTFGLSLLLSLLSVSASAQTVQRPFQPGEELTYKAEVSRALLKKIDVATFTFRVDGPARKAHSTTESPSIKFVGDVSSEGFFTKLFNLKFHQHVESLVDPDSGAVQKTIKLDEQGKRIRTSEATFDQKTRKVLWTETDPNDPNRPPWTLTAEFSGTVQDVVSAIYFLRSQKLALGTEVVLEISDSGRVYKVPVRVVERKTFNTALGKVSALHLEAGLFGDNAMVQRSGQFSLWLSDDVRHVPLKAQLKGEFGTFDITLKKATQLRPTAN